MSDRAGITDEDVIYLVHEDGQYLYRKQEQTVEIEGVLYHVLGDLSRGQGYTVLYEDTADRKVSTTFTMESMTAFRSRLTGGTGGLMAAAPEDEDEDRDSIQRRPLTLVNLDGAYYEVIVTDDGVPPVSDSETFGEDLMLGHG